MNPVKSWNVIFLVNKNPATRVILLHRAADKSYAPNFYTGIGGKIGDEPGLENETPLESAYRELSEETEDELSQAKIELHEFARCYFDTGLRFYYFYGFYNDNKPPHVNSKDGTLYWVRTRDLLTKDITPTTKAVCAEWAKRDFYIDKPFSLYVKETGQKRTVKLIEITNIVNELG